MADEGEETCEVMLMLVPSLPNFICHLHTFSVNISPSLSLRIHTRTHTLSPEFSSFRNSLTGIVCNRAVDPRVDPIAVLCHRGAFQVQRRVRQQQAVYHDDNARRFLSV